MKKEIEKLLGSGVFPEYFCEYIRELSDRAEVSDSFLQQLYALLKKQVNIVRQYESR